LIKGIKIGWLSLILMLDIMAGAQTELGLLPFSNKLLLNPSFAGWNKNTTVWSSLQFSGHPENKLNHTFTLTWDTWSERLKGGVALYYYQGLTGELNSNSSGAGLTFSKPIKTGTNGKLIPAIHFNAKTVFKQWFVQIIDGLVAEEILQPSPPGKEFIRCNIYQPRLGMLWNSNDIVMGASGAYSFQQNVSEEVNLQYNPLYHFIFHITRSTSGYRKGLISEPFKTVPELILLYTDNLFLTRIGITTERTDQLFGLFIQNNYSDNIHGISGILGWKLDHFRITFSAGSAYSVPHQKVTFFGEANLGLTIPYVDFDQDKPWAVPNKNF